MANKCRKGDGNDGEPKRGNDAVVLPLKAAKDDAHAQDEGCSRGEDEGSEPEYRCPSGCAQQGG